MESVDRRRSHLFRRVNAFRGMLSNRFCARNGSVWSREWCEGKGGQWAWQSLVWLAFSSGRFELIESTSQRVTRLNSHCHRFHHRQMFQIWSMFCLKWVCKRVREEMAQLAKTNSKETRRNEAVKQTSFKLRRRCRRNSYDRGKLMRHKLRSRSKERRRGKERIVFDVSRLALVHDNRRFFLHPTLLSVFFFVSCDFT